MHEPEVDYAQAAVAPDPNDLVMKMKMSGNRVAEVLVEGGVRDSLGVEVALRRTVVGADYLVGRFEEEGSYSDLDLVDKAFENMVRGVVGCCPAALDRKKGFASRVATACRRTLGDCRSVQSEMLGRERHNLEDEHEMRVGGYTGYADGGH